MVQLGHHLGIYSEGVDYFQSNKLNFSGINDYTKPELVFIEPNKKVSTVLTKPPPSAVIVDDKPVILEAVAQSRKDLTLILIDRLNYQNQNNQTNTYLTIHRLEDLLGYYR